MSDQKRRWNERGGYMEKRCSKCHRWLPMTPQYFHRSTGRSDNLYHQCKECKAQTSKAWRKKHPNYIADWKKANKDRVKASNKAYRENHRDQLRERKRLYRALNRDRIRARQQAYYRKNAEKFKQRRLERYHANPDQAHEIRNKSRQQYDNITEAEREAAGDLYRKDVVLASGSLARVVGRRGDFWLVRLHDPVKIGPNHFQRIVQARNVWTIEEIRHDLSKGTGKDD